MVREITFALITGIVSAVIYSLIQAGYSYIRWARTRDFFRQDISNVKHLIDYNVYLILNIDVVVENEYDDEHGLEHEELMDAIKSAEVSSTQLEQLNKLIQKAKEKIESKRRKALSIPTFSSKDFHAVDKFIMELGHFTTAYYFFFEELDDDPELTESLKTKLIGILNLSRESLFTRNKFDDLINWSRRRKFRQFVTQLNKKEGLGDLEP